MTEAIDAIEEDERDTRRVTWADVYTHFNAMRNDEAIHRKDLSVGEINLLDRTITTANTALMQTDFLSATDHMRRIISKNTPAGSNAVASAAQSTSIASRPKIRSLFDLASNGGKNAHSSLSQPSKRADFSIKESEQKGIEAFRKGIKTTLENLDVKTLKELQTTFKKVEDATTATSTLSANRPRLEAPRRPFEHTKNYMLLILDLHQSMETIITDCTDHLEAQTKQDIHEMEKLREEKIQAIEEHIRSMDNQESWSMLANIARYFTFASTAVLGATLLTSGVGGVAGYFLIASGGLGLANAAATDLGIWKGVVAYFTKCEEVQHRIAQQIDLAMTLISIGLGLIGGILAYQSNALELARQANGNTLTTKAKEVMSWFSALFMATAICGKYLSLRKDHLVRAEIEHIETKIFMLREQIKSTDVQTQQSLKMAQIITQEITKILASSELSLAN